jgi:hypothetical protein
MMRRFTSAPNPSSRVRSYIWRKPSSRPSVARCPYRTPSYRARLDDASAVAMR